MDPNATTPTPPPDTSAAPATQPAATPQTFTAEQVAERERIAAQKAHDAAEAAARKRYEERERQRTSTPATQQTTTQTPAAPTNGDDFGRVRAYERALARYDFTDDALAMLDEQFATAKPGDVGAWVAQRATAFRVPQRGATTPTPTTVTPAAQASPASAPPAAAMPPVTGNAAPSSAARVTDDVPLIDRSAAEQAAYTKQHGFVAFTDRVTREARDRSTRLRLR